jgi:hypothetical protein
VVAVVGLQRGSHDHIVAVIDVGGATARPLAELALPEPSYDFAPGLPVQVADVTADSRPDFLIRLVAGDNQPGVVVSDDGGSWRLVPIAPPNGAAGQAQPSDVYVARDPTFSGARLVSTSNDCLPDCASGHLTTLTWTYERPGGYFRA